MFGSEILDVAIGLIMLFLLLSLVVSSIKEALETVLNHRSKDLERGVREMFGDIHRKDWVPAFYQHPLITSLFRDEYVAGKTSNLPSYIPSRTFALAVIDMLASKHTPITPPGEPVASEDTILKSFETALTNLPAGSQLRGALEPLLRVSQGRLSALHVEIEKWFDGSMDRVAGWYKRRTQIIIAVVGLLMAAVMNVDALAIVRYLNTSAASRAVLMSRVEAYREGHAAAATDETMKTTDMADPLGYLQRQGGLPLGWVFSPTAPQTRADFERDWRSPPKQATGWLLKLAGILFTAFAVSLGAPFWFDLLNRFMVVRDTVKPEEKVVGEKKPTG